MRTERGEIHFIGYAVDNHEGRVSTAIESLDLAARTGVTHSGRLYELIGEPGRDPDARLRLGDVGSRNHPFSWHDYTKITHNFDHLSLWESAAISAAAGKARAASHWDTP